MSDKGSKITNVNFINKVLLLKRNVKKPPSQEVVLQAGCYCFMETLEWKKNDTILPPQIKTK